MLSTINRPMAGAAVTLTAAMLAIPMMAKSRTPVALLPVRPTNRMVRMVANPAPANGQIPVVSRPSTEKATRTSSALLPVGHWEGREGQNVRRGVRQQLGHLGKGLPELFHHSIQLAVDLGGRQLLVDGAHHARRSWVATPGWARLGTRVSRLAMK